MNEHKNTVPSKVRSFLFGGVNAKPSRRLLLPFVIVFAFIGAYLLFHSFAAVSCTGTSVTPSTFNKTLVNNSTSGTTFCLAPGTYNMTASILAKTNDKFIGTGADRSQTVLDFTNATLDSQSGNFYGIYGYGGATGQQGVGIQNLTIQNCKNATHTCHVLKTGWNWSMSNIDVHAADLGLESGTGSVCDNCYLHDNVVYGYSGEGTIQNSEVSFNGGTPDSGGSTGGSKSTHLVSLTWQNNYVHDNRGPAIWCDGCWTGSKIMVAGNRIENNSGPGVDFEITWGYCTTTTCVGKNTDGSAIDNTIGLAIAQNNTLKGNATDYIGRSCSYSAQIELNNSQGIVINNNTVDSSNGANALCVIDTLRTNDLFPTSPQCISPFTGSGNTFILKNVPNANGNGPSLVGEAGGDTTSGCPSYTPTNLSFKNNTYQLDSLTAQHWQWQGVGGSNNFMTSSQWQAVGQDSAASGSTYSLISSGTDAAPSVSLSASPTSVTPGSAVTLTASASDTDSTGVAKVDFYDGTTLLNSDSTSPYTYNWSTNTSTPTGPHNLTAKATDTGGLNNTSNVVSVTVNPPSDTTPPTVLLTTPTNGSTVVGTVSLGATATDTGSGVSQVEFRINNNYVYADTSSPYSYNWNSTSLVDGTYLVEAKATDNAGNTSTASIYITVANTPPPPTDNPPAVSLTSPTSGSTVTGTVSLNATATDTDSTPVAKVVFTVDGTNITNGTDTTSPYSVSWNSTAVSNGNHTIMATATDTAGLTSSNQYTVNVSNGDTTAPTAPTNLSATAPAYNQVVLNWSAATDNTGVAGYYVIRNGVTIATLTGSAVNYADTTVSGSTSYSYYLIAYDAAGNFSSNSNTAAITTPTKPDTTAPSTPTNLTATAVSSSQVNLAWTPSTDNTGVTSYDIYRNGAKFTNLVASTCTTVCSFGDTGLNASTVYTYFVIARDAAGNSSPASNQASATTQAPPPISQGNLQGTINGSNGSLLSGAKAVLTFGGSTHTYLTNTSGFYSATNIPTATYSVNYSASHFKSQTQSVTIITGQTVTKNVTLVKTGRK